MTGPQRRTLVIHSLEGGGAERDIADLAGRWAADGRDVTLITLSSAATDVYPLPPDVRRVALNVMGVSSSPLAAVRNNLRRIARLRAALVESRPDVVVSFSDTTNVLTLLAGRGAAWRVVISERIDPRHHRIGPAWSLLRRLTYPWCGALVVLTESVRGAARRLVRGRPVHVVPNPAHVPAGAMRPRYADDLRPRGGRIVAMGRLHRQKGFDLLIDAFGRIAPRHPDWRLDILGDGPERAALDSQIARQQLADRVRLRGWIADPAAVLSSADLFVLSSRYEGWGNALVEAMACGLPAVSFDCPSGPAEIVRPQVDGLLVPPDDVAALAAAMDRLMSDEALRRRMGDRGREVVERFSAERIFARWEEILAATVENRPSTALQ